MWSIPRSRDVVTEPHLSVRSLGFVALNGRTRSDADVERRAGHLVTALDRHPRAAPDRSTSVNPGARGADGFSRPAGGSAQQRIKAAVSEVDHSQRVLHRLDAAGP